MKFIKLTAVADDNPIYIAAHHITCINQTNCGTNIVFYMENDYVCVKETPEQIMELIG